jgi:hypothetical protein
MSVASPSSLLYVDLSGYAFTGKHAVIDLMREVERAHVPHFQFEFALLRIQGGILDLDHALCDSWSPIRSDAAIRRFRRVVRRFGASNHLTRPRSWFEAVGWNYDEYYGGRFFELSDRYLSRLVQDSWRAPWPYPLADLAGGELFVRKAKQKLRISSAMDFEVALSRPTDFIEATREYLQDVLTSNVSDDTATVVMHNAFEPFDPARSIRMFHHAKSVVVDRDPRDNYVQGLWYKPVATGVDQFIRRYRTYRTATNYMPHPDVLRIRFEDLIFEYDATVGRIFEHLGIAQSRHVRRRAYFDPEVSRKNVGLHRTHEDQPAIRAIERELAEFCDPRA